MINFEEIRNKTARILIRFGVSANFISVLGLYFAFLAGIMITRGQFTAAALVLLSSGVLDLLDGAVARQSGKKNPFGGILDSTLDRYGDGFVLGASILFYMQHRRPGVALLALSALLGSFVISYVRARSECEQRPCRVGFWERGERSACLIGGLWWGNLPMALLILGIGTHFTALFRLYYASGKKHSFYGRPNDWRSILFQTHDRKHTIWLVKCLLVVALLWGCRVPF